MKGKEYQKFVMSILLILRDGDTWPNISVFEKELSNF